MTIDRQLLLDALYAGPITVSFTKVNGDRRDMLCTLKKDLLPIRPEPKTDKTDKPARKENPNVQSVWDLTAKGWRSFRWENIIEDENG
jgi:hypothetical protein